MSENQRNGLAPLRVLTPRSAANAADSRKHKVVVETITQEKKKLRSVLTFKAQAPRGYTFIPAGNPQLTNALKDAARQENEQIYLVSTTPHQNVHDLSQQVHRIGFHFPNRIIDLVCVKYGIKVSSKGTLVDEYGSVPLQVSGAPSVRVRDHKARQPGEDQITINTKAREAITDLFPNIPNEDLWRIIKTAFQKGQHKVGTANELPLVRRAQLAVVAHIRHVYTEYDKLLRRGGYHTARTRVEKPTLEKLVAWRGDDENGSKMMEDVLKEVVVISDDESSEDDRVNETTKHRKRDASVETLSSDDDLKVLQIKPVNAGQIHTLDDSDQSFTEDQAPPGTRIKPLSKPHKESRKEREQRRGFDRYRLMAWDTAREHFRADPTQYTRPAGSVVHLQDSRTSPPHYPGTDTPHAAHSSTSNPLSVSRRADAESSQTTLRDDGRSRLNEALPRRALYDPPETVRLADGFLYERVPRSVLVRSDRSISPASPVGPTHRQRAGPSSSIPGRSFVSNVPGSNLTFHAVEKTRHDPERAIPSIERDQSPDAHSRLPSNIVQSYRPPPTAVSHRPDPSVSSRPVERLTDRVELIRLDGRSSGAKRRLDDAFSADDYQSQPRKFYRTAQSSAVPTIKAQGESKSTAVRPIAQPREGRSTVASGVVRHQGSPDTPLLVRQAIPVGEPTRTSVPFVMDRSAPRAEALNHLSDHSKPRPADRTDTQRFPTTGSGEIDRFHYSVVRSPVLSSNVSRTASLSQLDFLPQSGDMRYVSQHRPVASSSGTFRANPPAKRALEHDYLPEAHSHQLSHHDRVVRSQGQPAESHVVLNVGDRHRTSRHISPDLPNGSSKRQSEAVFLGPVSDHVINPSHKDRVAPSTLSSMLRKSHAQQSSGRFGSIHAPESLPRIKYSSAAKEVQPRQHTVVYPQDSGHIRYNDTIPSRKIDYTEPLKPVPYSLESRAPYTIEDGRVFHS